jgi:hypothetical protein
MTKPQSSRIKLAGFELTILGRQFPDSHDVWDGNWLHVVCTCRDAILNVEASGPFLNVGEILDLQSKLEQASSGEIDQDRVEIMEPNLGLSLSKAPGRKITLHVALQPDGKNQSERFEFTLSQSELEHAIEQCRVVLLNFPMRE